MVTLFTPSMQAEGNMTLSAVLAGTATIIAALARMEQRHDERGGDGGDRLQQVTDEYRRREAALIRTFASLAEVPAQPQRRLYRA
jgi:hypothetical protein